MDLVGEAAHAAHRGPARPGLPRPEPGVPGLVRAGPRADPDRQVALGAGRRDTRLVARRRIPDRGPVLDGSGDRPRGAAGRRGDRRAVGAVRGGRVEAAPPAAELAAGAGRAGRGAELLAAHRMAAVLAGARRPVGRVRRQPVAASGRARAGRGRRGVADQLRAGAGERGDRARPRGAAPGAPRRPVRPGARGARRGRRGGQRRRRAAGVRAHPGQPGRPRRRRSPWCSPGSSATRSSGWTPASG